jgi:hypothetical protein
MIASVGTPKHLRLFRTNRLKRELFLFSLTPFIFAITSQGHSMLA